ncbi:MAG: hypothetical protein ABIH17_10780 [Pseudomonadota bacterium]
MKGFYRMAASTSSALFWICRATKPLLSLGSVSIRAWMQRKAFGDLPLMYQAMAGNGAKF